MRRSEVFWGGLLIVAGLLFLAGNVWGFNAWAFLWPLFLIVVGAGVLWSVLREPGEVETKSLSYPLEGENGARIRIQYGAGRLSVSGGVASGVLLDGEFAGGVHHTRRRTGGRAEILLRTPNDFWSWWPWSPGAHDWDVHLSPEIPLTLKIESGANETRLDLRSLQVTDLRVETGASSTKIMLPEAAGQTHVKVEAGAASVHIAVPENVAARIESEVALGSISIDKQRFPRSGNVYASPDYTTAENRVDIHVEGGVGSLTVR
jgi:hypothetical protein